MFDLIITFHGVVVRGREIECIRHIPFPTFADAFEAQLSIRDPKVTTDIVPVTDV